MRKCCLAALSLAAVLLLPPLAAIGQEASGPGSEPDARNLVFDRDLYAGLGFRFVGPYRGGRVTAVAGFPDRAAHFLMGTVGGGVWKSVDAGETWTNLTDGHLNVGPVGAIAVAPSDPNVIWVGTGSAGVRGNVSVGDGVYRSTDGGRGWSHVGLPESEHINAIRVHPWDPDVAYVAALGHIFGPNPERGVYRTRDGGGSWEQVLFVSASTGAVDLVMDSTNPRILYAAMWQAERKPWALFSGGDEGGVYKSTDGGESWKKLSEGLPERTGRIGIAVSAAAPDRVWVLIEAEGDERGLYRSDDAGRHFRHLTSDRSLLARPWYYTHVDAHPTDPNLVYVSNEGFFRSIDGGENWTSMRTPHGDNHDLWINPKHPQIWIQSNDGGVNVTFTAGETWSTQLNQPTGEFYTVTVDDGSPYRLYAPQQDNSTISLSSVVTRALTPYEDWFEAAGCETGPIAVHPESPEIIYGACQGQISRLDRSTGQERPIWEYPQEYHGRANAELQYRHQWNSQIKISRHDPEVVYHTSQFVHRTTDGGQTWEIISPDLTRWEEHAHLHETPPGGPLTYDQTGVEIYGTVFALEESPHEPGVIWAGSDDGAIHLTRDGGRSWTEITPEGLPLHSTVNEIVLSSHRAGKAYAVVHRYRMDDFRPLVYRTTDYGASWRLLTDGATGVPADHPTRTIQEDPDREGLLYLGTEFGLFVSFDDGAHWQPFQLDLPETPVTDLVVHRGDLVVATQGRGLWILDDLSPLHQLTEAVATTQAHLFAAQPAVRMRLAYTGGSRVRWPENPEGPALFTYWLAGEPEGEVRLEVLDEEGELIRAYSSRPEHGEGKLADGRGTHRVSWDLRYPGAFVAPGVDERTFGPQARVQMITGYTGGPYAVPGTYRVRLSVGDEWSQERSFEVRKDPRLAEVTVRDLRNNFDLAIRVRDRISAIQREVHRLNAALEELAEVREWVDDSNLRERIERITAQLESVAGELYKHREEGDHAHLHPELTTSYARIATMLIAADYPPTASAYERFEELQAEFEALTARARVLLEGEIGELNRVLREVGLEPVHVPPAP